MDTLFSIYCFDPDSGELVRVVKHIDKLLAKGMACDLHCMEGYAIKLVNEADSVVEFTLGV